MFIQVFVKGTKRKVISFNNLKRIVIMDNYLMVYPLIGKNDSFDLSAFDFYILQ